METPTSSTRVLVVDDDPRQRSVLAEMVSALGFDVKTASDGKEALDIHSNEPFDVVLTDLIMPNMDGFEFLRKIDRKSVV